MEGSAVTFGANEFTNVVDVKGQDKKDLAEKLYNEITIIQKAVIGGKGTDNRLYELEMKLKYLTTQLTLLVTSDPGNQSIKQAKEREQVITPFNWGKVFNDLKG